MKGSLAQVAQQLRAQTGASISSVDDGSVTIVDFSCDDGVASALPALAAHVQGLAVATRGPRHIVFPVSCAALATTVVRDVAITSLSRPHVACEYFEHVRRQTRGAIDVGVTLKGNANAPLFTVPVTLSATNAFLDHLVELLGDDLAVAFALTEYAQNRWEFAFVP